MRSPVAVAICTYNRPKLLRALLDQVATIAPADLDGQFAAVVVVDDDRDGSARSVVEPARNDDLDVQYLNTASSDISTARNAAIYAAADLAPFVACIDDDCVPQPGWLSELLRVADQWQADIVIGHRRFVADPKAPVWLREQPFLLENELYADGSVPAVGNVANILIRSSWLLASGVRFRPDLGRLGGEDMVFLADARERGAEIRFAAHSVVCEPCDGRRSKFRYQLWRQAWLGNNEAQINARVGRHGRGRLAARGVRRVLRGITWPLFSLARTRRLELHWAVGLMASGTGLLAGAAGVALDHRS